MSLTVQLFFLDTAESEKNYFTGEQEEAVQFNTEVLSPGKYRVIDGCLYQVVAGIPPQLRETDQL